MGWSADVYIKHTLKVKLWSFFNVSSYGSATNPHKLFHKIFEMSEYRKRKHKSKI